MSRPAHPAAARRAALEHLRALLREAPQPRWATPALVALGVASSLAETLGIALIVAFVVAVTGQVADAGSAVGGWLGRALAWAHGVFGSPSALALAVLALIGARAGLRYANQLLGARTAERISEAVRNRLHASCLGAPYAFMQRHDEAQLMQVLGTDSWQIAGAHAALTRLVVAGCAVAVFGAFLLALSWPIALAALAGWFVLWRLLRGLSARAQALGERKKRVHRDLGEQMLTTVQALRTIRAYGHEAAHHGRFVRASAEARTTSLALMRLWSLLDPLTETGTLAILGAIVLAALHAGTPLPTLLAAAALLYRLQPPLRDVEGQWLALAHAEPQLRAVRELIEGAGDVGALLRAEAPPPARLVPQRAIRFEQVRFAYDTALAPALDGVTFEIPVGRTTALVGPSGAGKTTVIHLLLGLYAPQSGTILVDDAPLATLDRAAWLRALAVAGQDVDLIEGTVLDNILLANAQPSDDAVHDAALAAGVDEFVQPLAEGYNTWVGQQGHHFSGGQRQRIGLARALLRQPQLLILDEALNALDGALERRVRGAVEARMAGRTLLVISHHEATIARADHVIRLDGGRVVS